MAKEKAKEFLTHLMANPELAEKLKGFTQEELAEAIDEVKKDGGDPGDIVPHTGF